MLTSFYPVRLTTIPINASFVRILCSSEHSLNKLKSSALPGREFPLNFNVNFFVASVQGRMVSVLPCLKPEVLQDSYVETKFP